ncbi:ribosomal protein L19 [Colletotrichum navitas]|uniref:Ribosomal protein L19 n=1 Tax=Colletotrichum navitas TaxID=681940 RepID=A0AAD8Q026_9PEZI|nr:ribosomal protein L19 [Colletotrichum navitas]KAK1593356.1 ribosomal protein L19 [Colletotrichum navitas]
MSSSNTNQWPPRRPSKRSLRNGTFIVAGTGERSRRQFSLRGSSIEIPQPEVNGYRSLLTAETTRESIDVVKHNIKTTVRHFWAWLRSPAGKGVLKCTLAYLLGSMATFLSPISSFLGKPDGKHVVATLTVYFHASRTWGSMVEAVAIATFAVLYAELVAVLAMAFSVVVGGQLGLIPLSHVLILTFCIGGGMGFIGWVKQKLNNPLVNVGCTLSSIGIISVVTREEAIHEGHFSEVKIVQVLKMLVMGITITVTVNLLIWRVSARALLRASANSAAVSLADMLSMITRGFLNGSESEIMSGDFSQVARLYKTTYGKMTKSLRESKLEHWVLGREKIYNLEKALVKSLESLSQAIGGLRSAADTQFTLLKEIPQDPMAGQLSPGNTVFSPTLSRAMSQYLKGARDRFASLASIEEDDEIDDDNSHPSPTETTDGPPAPLPTFRSPSEIFELFIALLGPSMKSLAYTLSEILREQAFAKGADSTITVNPHFKHSLQDAMMLYSNARTHALQELYNSIELGRARSEKIQADIEEVAAACGHFSFSLQNVAEDINAYLTALEELKYAREIGSRSWNWLKIWRYFSSPTKPKEADPNNLDTERLLQQPMEPAEQPVRAIRKSAVPRGIPDTMIKQRDTFSWNAAPNASSIMRFASQQLLKSLRVLARDDIRFGVKVGFGAMVWAACAFIPATRPTYQHWRGEWGLLSFMIVASMTVGAANTTGTARFIGTIAGVSFAMIAWALSQGNGFVLAFLGWMVSFFSFYMMLVKSNAPFGRITLLSWNVTVLYAYSLSQKVDDDDDDEGGSNPLMFEICYHRFVAVSLGILWGIFVCRAIWPISGRKKFKEGLSVLYLQLGLIWKRGPLAMLLRSDNTRSYMRAGEEQALQRYAFKLEALRSAAKSEYELRGPFPDAAYARIMESTGKILDGFHAMRLVTSRRGQLSAGERALLEYTAPERAQLCDRICHVFQVLASSMMLEYPLTDAIPSVVGNKDRLLGKIYQFRKNHQPPSPKIGNGEGVQPQTSGNGYNGPITKNNVVVEEKDYALLYAYTLVTAQVAQELECVEREVENLFGVLHTEAFLLQ